MNKLNRKEVKEFLSNLPNNPRVAFNEILRKLREGKASNQLVKSLSNSGYSKIYLESAKYELAKMFQISEAELKLLQSKMNRKSKSEDGKIIKLSKGPEETEAQKLREEFPFLNDDTTPPEIYVLVGRKNTLFQKMNKLREYLDENRESMDEDTRAEYVQKIDEMFMENQAMWKELEHFKNNQEILGEHPIFDELIINQEVESLSTADAHKRIGTVKSNITRNSKKIEEKPDDPKVEQWKRKLSNYEYELKMLNAKLGIENTEHEKKSE